MSNGEELSLHEGAVIVTVILVIVAWIGFWVGQFVNDKVSGWAAVLGIFAPLIPILAYGLFVLK